MKTTPKSIETRERIYATALEQFRARGFHDTTMRGLARQAGLSPGAAYYYFRSKDEIVLEFYLRVHAELDARATELATETKDFRERLRGLIDFQLRLFEPHRNFLTVLYQNSVDPGSPLSPFGPDTEHIRRASIATFARLLEGSSLSPPRRLQAHLPYLFWLFDLAVLLFWLFDTSTKRRRTRLLLDLSIEIVLQLLRLARLAPARLLLSRVLALLDEFNFLPGP